MSATQSRKPAVTDVLHISKEAQNVINGLGIFLHVRHEIFSEKNASLNASI